MSQGTRLSAADRRRNERLERLRELVPPSSAILAIDLADEKQHAVLCDHDSRVLTRWTPKAKAWQLGGLLDRAVAVAAGRGFGSVTVACEPTGHRWQIVQQMAAERRLSMVCIQPLSMRRAREQEDYTTEKTDGKDAVIIARQAAKLHCYEPEQATESWALLRDAGIRRVQLVTDATGQQNRAADLLECVWPAALTAAPKRRFDSATWLACLHVVCVNHGGRLEQVSKLYRRGRAADDSTADGSTARLSLEAFARAAGRELGRYGGTRLQHRTVQAMFAALGDPGGVTARRLGGLERVGWAIEDLAETRRRLTRAETRMVDCLDQLGLTELVCSIPGLSAVGAAAILAETGNPASYSHARAVVKHAGLAPRQTASGEYSGTTRITGRGRPRLRLAAWRAVFGALPHNPVLRARYQHLTRRDTNPLNDGQARASLAATLLRWIHAITTQRVPFDAARTTKVKSSHNEAPMAA